MGRQQQRANPRRTASRAIGRSMWTENLRWPECACGSEEINTDTKKPAEAANLIRLIDMLENQRRAFVRRRNSKPLETRASVESSDVGSGMAEKLLATRKPMAVPSLDGL